ncbi:uncharacterized protein LOC131149321 isoform X2 [Malania oleifera]|uniref:uncharacterized protein LOC131149321 isoform X2 n=1 Tax=Malania oleifera TaxID=397392 RepID=UPI0025AE95B2|nr:uncharacterized protein LOC131149321 isoform X2 [Malania oleifera]
MSPPLLDTGTPAHTLHTHSHNPPFPRGRSRTRGHIQTPIFSAYSSLCMMNSSNVGNRASGSSNSSETDSNFFSNSSSPARSASENAAIGSVSRLSKPRLVKMRKHGSGSHHPRSTPLQDDRQSDSFYNPFRPGAVNFDPVSAGSQTGASVSGEIEPGKSAVDETFVFGAKRSDSSLNASLSMGKDLVDEMRKLRIKEDLFRAKDGVSNLNTGSSASSSLAEGSNRGGGLAFGSGNQRTSRFGGESMLSDLPYEMRKLNICKGSGDDECLKKTTHGDVRLNKCSSGSGDNVDSSVGGSFESTLPNELKKLNIKGSLELDSDNFTSNANGKGEFVFRSSQKGIDSHAESLAATLPNQMKNLNIKGSLDTKDKTILQDKMSRLKIGSGIGDSFVHTDTGASSSEVFVKGTQPVNLGDTKLHDLNKLFSKEFTFNAGMRGKDGNGGRVPIRQLNDDAKMTGANASTGLRFQPEGNASGAEFLGRPDFKHAFCFSSEQDVIGSPNVEFTTTKLKANAFSSLNQSLEFSAKREAAKDARSKKRRGKLRQPVPVQLRPGNDFVSTGSGAQPNLESSESYSPMEISPYRETLADNQCSREASVTSDESSCFDNNHALADPRPVVSDEAIDEDLVAATQCLEIDEDEVKCSETKERSGYRFGDDVSTGVPQEEPLSGAETESFKSANEQLDNNNDAIATSAETDVGLCSKTETQDSDGKMQFSFASSSEDIGRSSFTFAASSSTQSQLLSPARHNKKKNRMKVGHDSYNCTPNAKDPYTSSSGQLFELSGTSSLLPLRKGLTVDVSTPQYKGGNNSEVFEEQVIKQESIAASAAVAAAQDECEKWRLRGNQAYTNGDMSKAEDCYTRGLNCVSQKEASRSCLRALMLCYSNRAATRMSLGRIREALGDCMMATAIDPNFLRVQLRAANCCLALGEVEDASKYFKKCLQLGSDACVDRKISVEASEGLQKAQKVSEYMIHSAELLQRRTPNDVESALTVICDALSISLYSEKLLEMKAEALFLLQKYDEVIKLCEQTLGSAEKNSPMIGADGNLEKADNSELAKYSSSRIWCCCLSFKAYFYLGRLEEAHEMVEKLEGSGNEIQALKSSIPLIATVRELLRQKVLGNKAFQLGSHAEAVEHYTAALSCNIESRPFAAICFCNRAAAYQALGQITDAIADCSLSIAINGNYPKAISRRATLFEMIRDYEQAASDLQRLVSLLTKQVEEKANHSGPSDKLTSCVNDLRQAQLRLSSVEEAARKEIPLDMYLIFVHGMILKNKPGTLRAKAVETTHQEHIQISQIIPLREATAGDNGERYGDHMEILSLMGQKHLDQAGTADDTCEMHYEHLKIFMSCSEACMMMDLFRSYST